MNWIAPRTPHQAARLARHWTRAKVWSSIIAKVAQCSAHSCPALEQAPWFLVMQGFLEAVKQHRQQPRIFFTQGLRCLQNSSFLSFRHREANTLHWSDPLREWKLWRAWFSHRGHGMTPAFVTFLQCWWSTWTGLLHKCPINWQDWRDIELRYLSTSACMHPAWQKLFNALLMFARNRNRQRDSW